MTKWNEIADDHYVALSWSGGLGVDNDGYPLAPPCDTPTFSGGLDAYFSRVAQQSLSDYRCKFCRKVIGFYQRKPYNLGDGSPHRCLADARAESIKS